jgi:hypothetical protein
MSNSGRPRVCPLLGDVIARAVALVEAEPLQELVSAQFPGLPAVLPRAGDDRLVRQVISEDGRAGGAGVGDRFPEAGLCRPALLVG